MAVGLIKQLWHLVQDALGLILHHPILGTSVIPLLPDGRIVLVKRRDNGQWSLPGGMVGWREDIPTAVRRELKEETGLQLVELGRLVGVYSSPDRDPRFHSICVVVEAKVDGMMAIQDTLEITQIQAFTLSELPQDPLSHDHDRQLRDYLQGLTTLA